jgi:hypothetical protein
MIPKFFIDRPIFAWVIAIIIVLGGWLALRQLPVASYPPVAPPALAITVNYPGASAKVVEETAVALIEQELNGIENLLYMDSASEQNIGTITLTFKAGTNLDLASVETQNRIKRAEPRLPEEARRLGVTVVKSARNYLMFISLFSPDKLPRQRGARQLRRRQCAGKHPPHARRGRGHPVRHRILDAAVAQAGAPPCLRPDAGRRGQGGASAERPDRHRRTGSAAGDAGTGIRRDHHHSGPPVHARRIR